MTQPQGFIVVLHGEIIEIPQDSYVSWLTMFYALPRELVEKRPAYLELPRNINRLFDDEKYLNMIEDDAFLELVWDCWAWSVWQFFKIPHKDGTYHDIPGDWQNYSGDFPLWRLSYEILRYIRKKFETEMDWSFQRLFMMDIDDEVPWLDYKHFGNLVGNITDMIVEEQNWQPFIDEVWMKRDAADYSGSSSQRRDFDRSWNHDRNHKHLSLEEIAENGAVIDGDTLYDIPNPEADFEKNVLSSIQIEQFKSRLTEQNKRILQMRMEGYPLKDIAEAVGFKTPSAVSKHIEKIAGMYADFVDGEYDNFLDAHIEEQNTNE